MSGSLVIGASGMIGMHLAKTLESMSLDCASTYFRHPISNAYPLDIRQSADVQRLFLDLKPETIFVPAAFPNVDYCETHPEETYQVNVRGIEHIVRASDGIGAKIVYLSSDYIFDGKDGPYDEEYPASPISEYGRQKLAAEHFVGLFAKNYLIIRTTVVYGWETQGKNFVYRLVDSLRNSIPVKVPVDQIGTPTYVVDLAQSIVALSRMEAQGVFNVTGPDHISRYDFALQAAQIFGLPQELIQPVTTQELNQPAARPLIAGLKIDKATQLLHCAFVSSQEGLDHMRSQQLSINQQG